MKINIEDVFKLQEQRSEINKNMASENEYYKDGKKVDIPKSELDEWDFTGLSNTDFVTMRDWD
ncbi:MAG TPA: hypothetical protein EYN67_20440 [Flavobacteriales bacterium]|nr:hypothetical protein [Flavobacteriales bacterium]